MAVIANRRSVMTLFSGPTDIWSHRTRVALAEKNMNIDIVDVTGGVLPEDLLDLNPYNTVPTLVDRDLVLYDSRVIIEYLDERFPHPPLMPPAIMESNFDSHAPQQLDGGHHIIQRRHVLKQHWAL